ncbi:MAG: polysaccharide biosynthesis C-terminal domain-containing protein, partial [Oscillospiraceae bacterium]|nr:polysaccharide biosynthesis C-terminal domain-containing protein [Oscillospiraceae bacterium]
LLMTCFSKQLAAFQHQPDAWAAIACLGPCILLICTMSTFRGFFQGQGNMRPTAISQMLEALCKLIVGIIAAQMLLKTTGSVAYAAAGAILGVTTSCVVSVIYLFTRYWKFRKTMPVSNEPVLSYWETTKRLLSISIPIAIGAAGLSILTMLETRIFMGQLKQFHSQDVADMTKGIYDMTKTIYNMPIAFITPISVSIIPAITANITLKNHSGTRTTAESAIRIAALISAPCAVGLFVLAEPVTGLLGGYELGNLKLATMLMRLLSINLMIHAIILVSNAIMQALGHANLPVVNMLLGGILKLMAVYVLSGNVNIGIMGAPMGTTIGYLAIITLNILTLRRCTQEPPAVVRQAVRPLLAALCMGLVVYAAYYGLHLVSSSRLILCGGPIAVGVAVYALAAIKLKAITREDCLLLPKGEKIANLLRL